MMTQDAEWKQSTNFRYVESLDGPQLAWEYLRRNSAYRATWEERGVDTSKSAAAAWGLLSLVDPGLDGRHANPVWQPDPPRHCDSFGPYGKVVSPSVS
jgi:hypothetical protein